MELPIADNPPPTDDTAPKANETPVSKSSGVQTAVLAGLFGLMTATAGYYFGSSLETKKQRMQIQLSAYADFLKAQASWQRANTPKTGQDDPAKTDASLKIRDAAFRMVVFSPAPVVKAFAAFTALTTQEECYIPKAELDIYQRMSGEAISENIEDHEVAMALFACKLKQSP
jgi:hypothetical protein